MRCDEIQERFLELLYDEPGVSSAKPELEAHLSTCPRCRQELAELRNARELLQVWKDEPPVRPVNVGAPVMPFPARRFTAARLTRYAAVAAMVLLAFLALANAELTWNSEEFSFKTHWAAWGSGGSEYYTKEEFLGILKAVMDDYEARMMDSNVLMMKKLLNTVEAERHMDLRSIALLNQNRNDD
jgi:hypothetical protein